MSEYKLLSGLASADIGSDVEGDREFTYPKIKKDIVGALIEALTDLWFKDMRIKNLKNQIAELETKQKLVWDIISEAPDININMYSAEEVKDLDGTVNDLYRVLYSRNR